MDDIKYSKQDAKMTQGVAILAMLLLHLFCRFAEDFPGHPLIWINDNTPLLYWFGFFSEICVPLYSICAGYAYALMYQSGKGDIRSRINRVVKLIVNYWIILVIFTVMGMVVKSERIPGSLLDFFGNFLLITPHSYNGTWWYLITYIIIQLIPIVIIILPSERMHLFSGLGLCLALDALRWGVQKFSVLPDTISDQFLFNYMYTQVRNLCRVLPFIWIGGIFCKHKAVDKLYRYTSRRLPNKISLKVFSLSGLFFLFIITNIIHKALLMGCVAVGTFMLFNIWQKGNIARNIFLFLGENSTNIWLSHMFYISILFSIFTSKPRYSITVFAVILVLCLLTSALEKIINRGLIRLFKSRLLR